MIGDARQSGTRFRLGTGDGQRIALRDLRGSPVILVFYPATGSPLRRPGDAYNRSASTLWRSTRGISVAGCGATGRSRRVASSASPARRFRTQRCRRPTLTACIGETDGTSERALFVIDGTASSAGGTCPPWTSILAPTAFSKPWKR